MFKWGVAEELVAPEVYQALATVPGLRRGRTEAVERPPVAPVPPETVEATLPHLSTVVRAMVEVQRLTGMRPGELVIMRPCDVLKDVFEVNGVMVWVYYPGSDEEHGRHKNAWRGHGKAIAIGPRAQAVLAPFLDRDPQAYCFSPAESRAEHVASRKAARKSPLTPSQLTRKPKRAPKRKPGVRYTVSSYGHAVAKACARAGVGPWSPHRLRHAAATLIESKYGLDDARAVLGHNDPQVTLRYTQRNMQKAAEIAAEMG
jgi:integrase